MSSSSSPSLKSLRSHIAIPGALRETLKLRCSEFRYPHLSPFALELICFDLRKRREHLITRPYADDPIAVQEAIDLELARQYTPGSEPRGPLMQALFPGIADSGRPKLRGGYAVFRKYVSYSETLGPCIELRWRELGYPSLSAYVTGLIRYDLLLLGAHKYFNGDDTAPDLLAALDAETVRTFHENKRERGFLDQLLESAVGRSLTDEECAGILRRLSAQLREKALKQRGFAGVA